LNRGQASKLSLWEAERQIFGTTHSEVGAYLAGLWGLQDPILEVLAFHHCPNNSQRLGFSILTAVHIANVLEHEKHVEEPIGTLPQIDIDYLSKLDIADRLPVWKAACQEIVWSEA
jgi:HD-like signal output (HDOD) protein